MKFKVTTEYDESDCIVAYVDSPDLSRAVCYIFIANSIAEIQIEPEVLDKLPVVNAIDFMTRVLAALNAATTAETEIPFFVDAEFEI